MRRTRPKVIGLPPLLWGCALVLLLAAGAAAQDASPPPSDAGQGAPDAATTTAPDAQLSPAPPAPAVTAPSTKTDPKEAEKTAETQRRLDALLAGRLKEVGDLDALFAVQLDDLGAVKRRVRALSTERDKLRDSIDGLKLRLKNIQKEVPAPVAPPILADTLVAPVAPTPPTLVAPTPPAQPDGGTTPTARGDASLPSSDGGAAPTPQARYLAEKAAYEKARAEHAAAVEAHTKAAADHAAKRAAQTAARQAHETALAQHADTLVARRLELEDKVARLKVSVPIADARLKYLNAVAATLSKLPGPAIRALQSLNGKRDALRRQATALEEIAIAARALSKALLDASQRKFAGFVNTQRTLQASFVAARDTAEARAGDLDSYARDCKELAARLETQGETLRRTILGTVASPDAAARLNDLFLEHLNAQRRLRKALSAKAKSQMPNLDAPRTALLALIPNVQTAGTTDEAERAANAVTSQLHALELQVSGLQAIQLQWALLVEREAVSVLEPLVPDEVRKRAYSVSIELLNDFLIDLKEVRDTLSAWAEEKSDAFSNPGAIFADQEKLIEAVRVLLALALLLTMTALRRRVRPMVVWLVQAISRWRRISHRVGFVVRLAGLLEALLPTIIRGTVLYLALYLAGFQHPEVQILEIGVRWWVLYRLGRQFLHGLVWQVAAGRPALIEVEPHTAVLLVRTYAWGGLVFALSAAAAELADHWLGLGTLRSVVLFSAGVWMTVFWGLAAPIMWRETLASAWSGLAEEGSRQARLATFMATHRVGALLGPIALARILFDIAAEAFKKLASEKGILAWSRARSLRRMARKGADDPEKTATQLPQEYIDQFPMYPLLGEQKLVVLPREKPVADATAQFEKWQSTRTDGSLVILGDKGQGKTTLLGMIRDALGDVPVVEHIVRRKVITVQGLVDDLAPSFGLTSGSVDLEGLIQHCLEGPERVVLMDEAHNVFLRAIGGFKAFDALVKLVNATSDKVFWALVFNRYSWTFINQTRKRVHYFRRLLQVPSWSPEELQRLIASRNMRTGYEIEFDEMLLDTPAAGQGGFRLVASAEGYFRLLGEARRGNPRVATYIWLQCLEVIGDKRLKVRLFSDNSNEMLEKLDSELLFVLAAVCQHENLSAEDLATCINVPYDFADFAIRFLTEGGLLETKGLDPGRTTLSPRHYISVLNALRGKHLLFE